MDATADLCYLFTSPHMPSSRHVWNEEASLAFDCKLQRWLERSKDGQMRGSTRINFQATTWYFVLLDATPATTNSELILFSSLLQSLVLVIFSGGISWRSSSPVSFLKKVSFCWLCEHLSLFYCTIVCPCISNCYNCHVFTILWHARHHQRWMLKESRKRVI